MYHLIDRSSNTLSSYEDDLKNISTSNRPQIYIPSTNISSFNLFNQRGDKIYINHPRYYYSTIKTTSINNLSSLVCVLSALVCILYVFFQFYAVFTMLFTMILEHRIALISSNFEIPLQEIPLQANPKPIIHVKRVLYEDDLKYFILKRSIFSDYNTHNFVQTDLEQVKCVQPIRLGNFVNPNDLAPRKPISNLNDLD